MESCRAALERADAGIVGPFLQVQVFKSRGSRSQILFLYMVPLVPDTMIFVHLDPKVDEYRTCILKVGYFGQLRAPGIVGPRVLR